MQGGAQFYFFGVWAVFVIIPQYSQILIIIYNIINTNLQDPQKNRLAQWKDVYADSGIVELSYELSPETTQGTFNIMTEDVKLEFSVDEYSKLFFFQMKQS